MLESVWLWQWTNRKKRETVLKRRSQKRNGKLTYKHCMDAFGPFGYYLGNNDRVSSRHKSLSRAQLNEMSAYHLPKVMNIDSPCGHKTDSGLRAIGPGVGIDQLISWFLGEKAGEG
jgi:hypothetical protein